MVRRRHRHRHSSDGSSSDSETNTEGESDAGYETDITDPDLPRGRSTGGGRGEDGRRSVLEDTDEGTDGDPDDDTDEEVTSNDEDDDYADASRNLIDRLEDRWHRYCNKKRREPSANMMWKDPRKALCGASRNDLHRFFNWGLKLVRGKGGRRLKGTRKCSSLKGDWRYFRLYYERETSEKLDRKLSRRMKKSLRRLAKKHHLDAQEREKTPMYVEDLIPFQETVLRSTEKRFYLGRQRIELCLYNLLACFSVNRTGAILALQYKHIRVSLQRDPHGGPHRVLLEFTYEFTKKYLGLKKATTFSIPEIIYDPSLILSPHTFLLGILFADQAFKAPGLTSPEQLGKLHIEGGRQQLPLPLDPEKADYFVFCKTRKVLDGVEVLHRDRLPQSTISSLLKTFGEITGFLHPMFTYRFRYGGGKILNQSGLVSDAQQNLIMKHADIRTFLDHYLPQRVDTDMVGLMRGFDPDSEMMRAVTRMSRWIDTRRPRGLTDEQKESVEQDPELQKAINERDAMKQRLGGSAKSHVGMPDYNKLEKLKKCVVNTRNRLQYALRKKIREEFETKQAVIDIERQLSGCAVNEDAKEALTAEEEMLPDQADLIAKLTTWPTSRSIEDEWHRRCEAIDAVRVYCDVLEGGPRRGRRPKPSEPQPDREACGEEKEEAAPSPAKVLLDSTHEHLLQAEKPLACFQCFGKQDLPIHRRTKRYNRPQDVSRHFRTEHLESAKCNLCEIPVLHQMHLQSHAKRVHRLHT